MTSIQQLLRTARAHEQAASDFRTEAFDRYMKSTEDAPQTHREHGEHSLAYSVYENSRAWHEQAFKALRLIERAADYLA